MSFPSRATIERFPMKEPGRFRLKLRFRDITIDNDGSMLLWLNRSDVNNLHLDCSSALLDDDIETGVTNIEVVE